MSDKKSNRTNELSKSNEIVASKPKVTRRIKKSKKTTAIKQAPAQDAWQAFDDAFTRFRSDFEDLLFPQTVNHFFTQLPEVRVPIVDLEDRGKDFLLKAEMPGFKKGEVELNVQEDGIEISGVAGWKYSEKDQDYVCKERACKSFYRYVELPEEIKVDEVDAAINDGLLEVTIPKKQPKRKRKVSVE